ncbi:10384_t:CDS:2 [Dentiscutata erythropus]|uniref:10384_t:CDS:1 n=1 Tax=Dentiscutata erythropus TaxID=1348616 RepID=A0A9N9DAA1_9GLOM|nr:10384_t:CDS:2 [Dentiscutata erythropus]
MKAKPHSEEPEGGKFIFTQIKQIKLNTPLIKLPSIITNHESVAVSARKTSAFTNNKTLKSKPIVEKSNKNQHQILYNHSIQPVIMTPDDNGILQRPPKICVDYLSHEWNKEDDLWTSWRVMLKDSDVTWLYGPLHTAWHSGHETSCQESPTSEDELNLMPSSARHKSYKSCLKKEKSFPETLRPKDTNHLISSHSDTQLYKKLQKVDDSDVSDCDTSSTCSSISGPSTPLAGPTRSSILPPVAEDSIVQQHHIRFNDQVEQCIAVDSADEDEDLNDSDLDSSSSDEGLEMNISLKKKKRDCSTICKLAPTKLKTDSINYGVYSSSKRCSTTTTSSTSSYSTTPPWTFDDDDLDVDDIDIDMGFDLGIIQPLQGDFNEQGIVDRAVNMVNNVREIVNWCSSMVFNI